MIVMLSFLLPIITKVQGRFKRQQKNSTGKYFVGGWVFYEPSIELAFVS